MAKLQQIRSLLSRSVFGCWFDQATGMFSNVHFCAVYLSLNKTKQEKPC